MFHVPCFSHFSKFDSLPEMNYQQIEVQEGEKYEIHLGEKGKFIFVAQDSGMVKYPSYMVQQLPCVAFSER